MISEEGIESLYRSYPAILAKQVPYTVTQLVSFEFVKSLLIPLFLGNGLHASFAGVGNEGVGKFLVTFLASIVSVSPVNFEAISYFPIGSFISRGFPPRRYPVNEMEQERWKLQFRLFSRRDFKF